MSKADDMDLWTEALRRMLERSGIAPDVEQPCPYLPDRLSRNLAFRASHLPSGIYQSLMDLNFRRSGTIFYRPACRTCRQCQELRVPVGEFKLNRTQRRCWTRNQDIAAEIGLPEPTREKYELYRRYIRVRHDRQMDNSWKGFVEFLYESPVLSLEVVYRCKGRLVGVGLIDVEPLAVSTLYCMFDTDETKRSLGVFNILWTIEYCRRQGIPYLYLGYYIHDSSKMNYKLAFRPCEVLFDDRMWRRYER